MDAAAFLAIATICAPLVHPSTAHAIVATESAFNPNAIGVVGGSLVRQPRDLAEAIATARALRASHRTFSVGLAQINVHNLGPLGLTLEEGFDTCKNLRAMQSVLGECFDRTAPSGGPQAALRRALSCYYSGNFSTGFRDGYVNRVVARSDRIARAPP